MSSRVDYANNSTLRADATFRDTSGALLDPDAVVAVVRDVLDGTSETFTYGTDDELTRVSAGVYRLEDTYGESGIWTVTITGTKDDVVVSEFVEFGVRPGAT